MVGGAALGAAAVAMLGAGAASQLSGDSSPQTFAAASAEPRCEMEGPLNSQACFAAGVIRYVSLGNLQGAGQFCKWRSGSPGEWSRLKAYAQQGAAAPPANIVSWFGNHIFNDIQAYFAAGGPPFTIMPNTAPNACRTPLPPPVVQGVTPGQTDVTVTVAPG